VAGIALASLFLKISFSTKVLLFLLFRRKLFLEAEISFSASEGTKALPFAILLPRLDFPNIIEEFRIVDARMTP
jgi:hypothetical protein